jgi:hypothetical protein
MVTKNISAKDARKMTKNTVHRPPKSPLFKLTEEDFSLFEGGHSDPISSEISQTPFENAKATPTTLINNGSRPIVARRGRTTNRLE